MDGSAPILLTGASGYVGGRLLEVLLARGLPVRAMVREPGGRAFDERVQVVQGDAVSGEGLVEALDGVASAYYLIHSMGRGSGSVDQFAELDRRAARNFGDAARAAQVPQVVYLGGLEAANGDGSEHLNSRHEVAELLGERIDSLVYARAAMVVGAGSASFEMLRYLVLRLPAMICPRWIDTRTQPIAVGDVAGTLADVPGRSELSGELQLGGADVLTYREMMRRFARVAGRRPPRIVGVPAFSPRLSSYWVSLVTPVERGLVQPLVEGLRSETVVRNPPPPGLNDRPLGFEQAVRAALEES